MKIDDFIPWVILTGMVILAILGIGALRQINNGNRETGMKKFRTYFRYFIYYIVIIICFSLIYHWLRS